MLRRNVLLSALALVAALALPATPRAEDQTITLASTTSTHDSGLFRHILPMFEANTGIKVKVLALGTGEALDTARRGEADVVLVHAPPEERKFVEEGFSTKRYPVMYNDFIVVGPKSDPAKIADPKDSTAAFKKIAEAKAPFVSRGDKSGTNIAELALWKAAGIEPKGDWYHEAHEGMAATLHKAGAMNAYTLADRGTWIAFKNKGNLEIAVEGDKRLLNQYGLMLVNPAKFPKVKAAEGQKFIDWLVGPEGQRAIADFKIEGKQLFFPNANDPNA